MSSVPPKMPPGGGPPPPYDAKAQWRLWREQQKAAWRAQRDAMRAQRHAWKAQYRGFHGPRVPSIVGPILLIAIGVIAFALTTGHLAAGAFWAWYGRWWPLVLIGAGVALLAEWALDMRRKTPVRRSGGFVGILILLAIVGAIAAAHNHFSWRPFGGAWDGNNFFGNFGLPEHDLDRPAETRPIPANASIQIVNPHGDVSITASDQANLQLQAHEVAYADSDAGAQKIFNAEAVTIAVNGNAVTIESPGSDKGKVNLTVAVPRSAHVTVNAGWDNVTASGLGAGIDITSRGDMHLNAIAGPVVAHFVQGRHDVFAAQQIQGNVTMEGDVDEISLADITGGVTQSGEIPGDVSMENVAGPVHLRTSVTTVDAASLGGSLTLNDDALRINGAGGSVHVTTHSKDVDLSQIAGDTSVEDRDGSIRIAPEGVFNVEAHNGKGDVEITLAPNASATVSGQAHNGDIVTDFALTVSGHEDKTVSGRIGSGAARIELSAKNGDLYLRKGATAPSVPAAESAPIAPHARHLKAAKALPAQPVEQ